MFGIPNQYLEEIAQFNVRHSWAIFFMTGKESSHRIEQSLFSWIKNVTRDDTVIARVLREMLFLYLERNAVSEFNQRHPGLLFQDVLPFLATAHEAVRFGLDRLSFPPDQDIIDSTVVYLHQMERNELTPFSKVDIAAALESLPGGNPFFPVGMRPIFWANAELEKFPPFVPTKFLGIIDLETGYTFATASDRYRLYTNKEVFDLLEEIAQKVFYTSRPYDIITKTFLFKGRGVFKALAIRPEDIYQPFLNDGWQAIIEAINSYDKTEPLRYTFGYVNQRFGIPILMMNYSISVSTAHIISFSVFRNKVLERMTWDREMKEIEKSFRDRLESLKRTPLSDRDMLPLFCKYFNFDQLPDSQIDSNLLVDQLCRVEDYVKTETRNYGKNAYAMLNVIMSYLSETSESVRFHNEKQLGGWVEEFTKAASQPGFSISTYIGPRAYDLVSWFSLQESD